jgi:hypothetical protein
MRRRRRFIAAAACAAPIAAAACSLIYDPDRYERGRPASDGSTADAEPGDGACANVLTDPMNCGVCGHDCQGAKCAEGLCAGQVVVKEIPHPSSLLYRSRLLFWTQSDGVGSISPAGTGTANPVVSPFPDAGIANAQIPIIVRDSTKLLVAVTWGGGAGSQLYVTSKAATFGAPMGLLAGSDGSHLLALPFVTEDSDVFVSTIGTSVPGGQILGFRGLASNGAVLFESTKTQPLDVAVSGTRVFFSALTRPITDAGLGPGDSIFCQDPDAGADAATGVTSGEALVSGLTLGQGRLYWGAADRGGVVRRVTADGGTPEDFVSAPRIEGNLAVSDTMLFWRTREHSDASSSDVLALWGCLLANCSPIHFADVPADVELQGVISVKVALAGGDDWLYWSEPVNGVINRVSTKIR